MYAMYALFTFYKCAVRQVMFITCSTLSYVYYFAGFVPVYTGLLNKHETQDKHFFLMWIITNPVLHKQIYFLKKIHRKKVLLIFKEFHFHKFLC
mgnify:CR=1 FL=1